MPVIQFTKGDLLRNQPINPDWYDVEIIKVKQEAVEGKINVTVTLKFEDQMLAADERTIDHTFYNCVGKGSGFVIPFMAGIINKPIKEVADGLEKGTAYAFNLDETLEGKKVKARLENEMFQGNQLNKVKAWLPHGAAVPF